MSTVLEILCPIQGYAPGEIAGFPVEIAERLVLAGVAKQYEDVSCSGPECYSVSHGHTVGEPTGDEDEEETDGSPPGEDEAPVFVQMALKGPPTHTAILGDEQTVRKESGHAPKAGAKSTKDRAKEGKP